MKRTLSVFSLLIFIGVSWSVSASNPIIKPPHVPCQRLTADYRILKQSGPNMRGQDLVRADLKGANLKEADLSDANLTGANLEGADLSEATLHRANLTNANLRGANSVSYTHLRAHET